MISEETKKKIREFARGAGKLCVLCIGNPLGGDDAAAIVLGKILKKHFDNVLICYTDPTSYIFRILREFDSVIVVDAADFGGKPGECKVIEPEYPYLFTTHDFPVQEIAAMLRDKGKKVLIVGIQPKRLEYGDLSKEVAQTVHELAETLKNILTQTLNK